MRATIHVTGDPFMVSAFYGRVEENFHADEKINVKSTNGRGCLKSIRKVFNQAGGNCLVDLF